MTRLNHTVHYPKMIQLFRRWNQTGNTHRRLVTIINHKITQPKKIQPHRKASRSGITIRLSIIVGAPVLHELPETILNLLLTPAPPYTRVKVSSCHKRPYSPVRERDNDNGSSRRSPKPTRQCDNHNSLSSRDCNSITYENYSPDNSIKFPTSYLNEEYSIALQKCFLEQRYFPINTPDYLLEGPEDDDSMKSKKSSATKVYLLLMCNHTNCEVPEMFLSGLKNRSRSSSPMKGKTQQGFNSNPRHTASDELLQIPLPYVKQFLMSLPHCLPLEMGFHRLQRSSFAYCPLQLIMKGWRRRFGLCTMETEQHTSCT